MMVSTAGASDTLGTSDEAAEKLEAKRKAKEERIAKYGTEAPSAWRLHAGNAWNPLGDFPRNAPCWCGKDAKAKKCCLPKIVPYVTEKVAAHLRPAVEAAKLGKPVKLEFRPSGVQAEARSE